MTARSITRSAILSFVSTMLSISAVFTGVSPAAADADRFYALYVPPHKITQRTVDEIVHYSNLTPVNAVVLHVKTPKGRLLWPSDNAVARRLNVSAEHSGLAKHLAGFKARGIHTIAKLDVFADHRLAAEMSELSVIDASTGMPWSDANGLHWSNPSDSRVWDYNIALAKELAQMGFAEIQFDYVRFPSDGNLSAIRYPNTTPGFSKSDCIQSFLERAHASLKPLGVLVSADIFGLTAWKTDDFGVGQVLEKMAPHLDVICPMFYPSHFPSGFLGKQSPGDFPEMIMETSMRSMQQRTAKPIRPWIQGFWYRSDQIAAQIDGIENAAGESWSIWNPTGRYDLSYRALADRSGVALTPPQFYPTLADLTDSQDCSIRGHSTVVNYTSFKSGYSILSLEAPQQGKRSRYASPSAVMGTFEEGLMDHILRSREVRFNPNAEPHTKRKMLSDLLLGDLGKDARRMRPEPIYIDWSADCRFSTQDIPRARLENYARAVRQETHAPSDDAVHADPINVADITESIFGVTVDVKVRPTDAIVAQ
ncbi:MAG TPA: putative glycoside hydrolase [Desulfosarcina sp.]|nr:putative glycoside hydrolase [Desulfosarcina sp.]